MQMLGKSDAFTMSLDAPDADDPADLAAHSLDFWLTTEDLPLADNRVELDRTAASSSLHADEPRGPRPAEGQVPVLLDTMRCQRRRDRAEHTTSAASSASPASPTRTARPLRHRSGDVGARRQLPAHDVDNLYVADSSFFVSSSAVNPTLTIIANALASPTTSPSGWPDTRDHIRP